MANTAGMPALVGKVHRSIPVPGLATTTTAVSTMQQCHKVEGIIEAEELAGRTSITRNYYRYPLKFLAVDTAKRPSTIGHTQCNAEEDDGLAKRRGPSAPVWIYAVTYGGGLVAGDDIGLRFHVRQNAAVAITTQASTKVYKSKNVNVSSASSRSNINQDDNRLVCSQTLIADVEAGGLLAVVPHAVTCFADARYKQRQVVRMAEGANLILVDWLTSGRVARGEEWAFDNYETANDVYIDNQLLVHEAVRLSAKDGPPSIAEKMRGYNAMATILVIGPNLLGHAQRILGEISRLKVNASKEVPLLCSASPIHRKTAESQASAASGEVIGTIIKIAAKKTSQVTEVIHQHFNPLWQEVLGGDPYRL